MPNTQLHTALSKPRYDRYLLACGEHERAMKLYRANITLCKEMYGVIGIFEIILRNTIDRHMIAVKGDMWLEDAVSEDGYLNINEGCADSFHSVQESIHRLGLKYNHDRLIASLTLGFWRYQFAAKEYAASNCKLLDIFKNRPFGTKQKDVLKKLIQINDIRNRIAHHEPICFIENDIAVDRTERRYNTILELLEWLGCNSQELLREIDGVNNALIEIRKIVSE